MKIDIEDVRELKRQIDKINSQSLHLIELYENGKKIETDPVVIDVLEHTSLSNFNIILDQFLYNRR